MELREYVAESLERVRAATLSVVKDLTSEELLWRPGPEANHIGFLLWHIARWDDYPFNPCVSNHEQVWIAQRWYRRFGLKPEDTGTGWTPQQVADWTPPPLQELLQYMREARDSIIAGLKELDLGRLEERPRLDRPEQTIANILQGRVMHEANHQGEIQYLLGLKRRSS